MNGVSRAAALLAALLSAGRSSPSLSQQPYSGHGAGSVSPELVAKYAAPPLDPAVSRRIQAMLDVRAPGLGVVSPDGSRLYFGWRITGTPQVFRLNAPKGFPVQMTGGEDRTSVAGDHAGRQVARRSRATSAARRTRGSTSSRRTAAPSRRSRRPRRSRRSSTS